MNTEESLDPKDAVEQLFRNAELVMTGQSLDVLQYSLNLSAKRLDANAIHALCLLLYPAFDQSQLEKQQAHLASLYLRQARRRLTAQQSGLSLSRGDVKQPDITALTSLVLEDEDYDEASLDELDAINWRDIIRVYGTRRYRVQRVDLSNNSITSEGVKLLADALAQPGCWCRELDLSENRIDTRGLQLLAKALAKNTSLRVLNLSSNGSLAGGAEAESKGDNQSFSLFCTSLVERALGNVLQGFTASTDRSRAARLQYVLEKMSLHEADLARSGQLGSWQGLNSLTLRACNLQPIHIPMILESLPALRSLDIGENPGLGDDAARVLALYILGPAARFPADVASSLYATKEVPSLRKVKSSSSSVPTPEPNALASFDSVHRKWVEMLSDEVRRNRLLAGRTRPPLDAKNATEEVHDPEVEAITTVKMSKPQLYAWFNVLGVSSTIRDVIVSAMANAAKPVSPGELLALAISCSDVQLDRLGLENIGLTHVGLSQVAEAIIARRKFDSDNKLHSNFLRTPKFVVRSLVLDGNWLPGNRSGSKHNRPQSARDLFGLSQDESANLDESTHSVFSLSEEFQQPGGDEELTDQHCAHALSLLERAVRMCTDLVDVSLVGCGASPELVHQIIEATAANAKHQREAAEPWLVIAASLAAARAHKQQHQVAPSTVNETTLTLARTQGIILPLIARVAEYACMRNSYDNSGMLPTDFPNWLDTGSGAGSIAGTQRQTQGMIQELRLLHEAAAGSSQTEALRGEHAAQYVDLVASRLDTYAGVAAPRPIADVFGSPALTFGEYAAFAKDLTEATQVWVAPNSSKEAALQAAILGRYAEKRDANRPPTASMKKLDSTTAGKHAAEARAMLRLLNSHAFADYAASALGTAPPPPEHPVSKRPPSAPAPKNEGKYRSTTAPSDTSVADGAKPTKDQLIRAARLVGLGIREQPSLRPTSLHTATRVDSRHSAFHAAVHAVELATPLPPTPTPPQSFAEKQPPSGNVVDTVVPSQGASPEFQGATASPSSGGTRLQVPIAGRRASLKTSATTVADAKEIYARYLAGLPSLPPTGGHRNPRAIRPESKAIPESVPSSKVQKAPIPAAAIASRVQSRRRSMTGVDSKASPAENPTRVDTHSSTSKGAGRSSETTPDTLAPSAPKEIPSAQEKQVFTQWPSFARPAFRR